MINSFEAGLQKYLGEDRLKKIQQVKIGIAGAGGLGSNCAFNLVRSGFKKFIIADFDRVEASNLNRQFYFLDQVGQYKVVALQENLLKINPDLEIEIKKVEIKQVNIKEIFGQCNVLVEAFDQIKSKKLMVASFMNSNKFLVAATGLAGWGLSDEIMTKKIKDNFYLVGDMITEVSKVLPPISPRVNIAAAKQADLILEAVLEGKI